MCVIAVSKLDLIRNYAEKPYKYTKNNAMGRPGRKTGTAKTGGRVKGSVNKTTAELRQLVASIVEKNIDKVNDDLAKMQPKDRVAMLEKLMAYVLPRMQAITANVSAEVEQRSRIDFGKLSDKEITEIADKVQDAIKE